jgi:hypothetical protein
MEMSDRLRPRFNASDEFDKIRLQGDGNELHNRDAIFHRIVLIGFVFSRSSEGAQGIAGAGDAAAVERGILRRPRRLPHPADREKGRPVKKLELRAADGRLLGDGDTEVRPSSGARRGRRV